MPRFGIVGPSYTSQALNADAQALINWYVEQIESGAGNAPLALYPSPGTKTFVNLGRTVAPSQNGPVTFDQQTSASGTGTAVTTPTLTPGSANELGMFLAANTQLFTLGTGWTQFDNAFGNAILAYQVSSSPMSGSATLAVSNNWASTLTLFKNVGTAAPVKVQTLPIVSGATAAPVTQTFGSPITAGNQIWMIAIQNNASFVASCSASDNKGNTYNLRGNVSSGGYQVFFFVSENVAAGVTSVTFTPAGLMNSLTVVAYEMQAGRNAVTNNGPTRGSLTINGRTFFVCGTDFDEIFSNGTFQTWGTVANDALPVTMAASPQQLLLASAGTAYVFDLMANTLTAIPGVTFSGPVSQAGICDGFFILTIKKSKTFYVSGPLNANDWTTNGSAIVSVFPDNIVSMIVDHRQIWFESDTKSVVYYDSGNVFPFDVIPGSFMESGAAAQNSLAQLANGVIWLGSDDRGRGVVWIASPGGSAPQRVSNHAIEFAIQGYARIDDAVGFTYQDQGHIFYVLYFPTPSVTWVYDFNTQMWHQRGYFVTAIGDFRAVRYWNHTFNFNKHLVGDWQSGRVYQLNIPVYTAGVWTFADDDGNPVVRIRRAPHISNEQKRQFHSELQLYMETGLGPQPPLTNPDGTFRGPFVDLRWSDDGGHTWSPYFTRDAGQAGKFYTRVRWLKLGRARDRIYEIRCADPIGYRIVDAYLRFAPGEDLEG